MLGVQDLKQALTPDLRKSGANISIEDVKSLTAPGENYGSLLLSLTILIEDAASGKTESLQAVAKAVPKNDFIQNFFMSSLTFKKELHFYKTVVPRMRRFQLDQGMEDVVDFTANFYGGRLALEGYSGKADKNAVIIMENLKTRGYVIAERSVGFDFDTACLIIKNIALLHVLPIAIKMKNRELFDVMVEPYIQYTDVFTQSMSKDMQNESIEDILNLASDNPKCINHLRNLESKLEQCYRASHDRIPGNRPFLTITHNDIWVNNLMVKFDENGKPLENKIVDYQFLNLGSPGKDLIFFIFDSVQNDVIRSRYQDLIRTYHNTLISVLKELKVDTTVFTLEKLEEELEFAAKETFAIGQCFAMLRPIFAVKESVTDVENLSNDNIFQYKNTTKAHRDKLCLLIEEFAKRKWI
ncbi:uncharacterized protein [Euwallacea fornicatus]|uniref:uncharacterized protein n=1 Tax=Euwallacea fornicatus TaxID=995702 RepID=UPI00338DF8E4